ncbi:MAG: hypothetical protein ACERKV_05130 [Clostridiaceae bacterium]
MINATENQNDSHLFNSFSIPARTVLPVLVSLYISLGRNSFADSYSLSMSSVHTESLML